MEEGRKGGRKYDKRLDGRRRSDGDNIRTFIGYSNATPWSLLVFVRHGGFMSPRELLQRCTSSRATVRREQELSQEETEKKKLTKN